MDETRNVKIQVRGVSKVFGKNPKSALELRDQGLNRSEILEKTGQTLGLSNISFDVYEGELLVIMGLSGSGKSTLIRCLNRLIDTSEGDILIDDEHIPSLSEKALLECRRRHFSMVFQNFALFPHKTVLQNAQFGLEIRGISPAERDKTARESLTQVGLDGWEDAYPNQLSGGMQQRVGLARALANDASVLLMDEAFSALDPLIRTDMQDILLDLQEELHKTIVFITHDLDEALRIGDRISILRDGEIVQQGDPQDIIMRPADDYISDFIKDINRGRVIEVRSVMTAASRATGPKLTEDTPIEDALQMLSSAGKDSGTVVDGDGKTIGKIEMNNAIAAMARPERDKGTPRYK